MSKVVHFEIPIDDTERAREFYREVFGWKINPVPDMDYTVVHTGPTDKNNMPEETGFINGGLTRRQPDRKSSVITIDVDDIDKILEKIVDLGGKVVEKKMDVGNMGYAAYFKDSEDNVVGLWQNKPKI